MLWDGGENIKLCVCLVFAAITFHFSFGIIFNDVYTMLEYKLIMNLFINKFTHTRTICSIFHFFWTESMIKELGDSCFREEITKLS